MVEQSNTPRARVLVVDDEPVMCALISTVLKTLGCEVVAEAEDDKSAMQAFKAHKPDITFLDIKLGHTNGLDVLKRIVGIAPAARVVMLTGMEDPTVAEHCLLHGAQGYIVKGGGSDHMKDAMEQQLKLYGC